MKQVFIGVVGYQGAGKSTFSKKILERFPDLNYIRTDGIRDFLISNYSYYNCVKYSYLNSEIKSANVSVAKLVRSLIEEFGKAGKSVLLDSMGRKKSKWKDYFDIFDSSVENSVLNIIVFIDIDSKVAIERLKQRDEENPGDRWVESFSSRWMKSFEKPEISDADNLLIVRDGNDNEVLDKLSELLE